ncbi:MAG: polysaccharide ABC transporter ATP-binding protein [Candidatus Sumerlaeia bacterium]|nr:polysaccharide ABC transporter ATP-binding protein [Candidatus Sumerlaeia bacterium]
MTATLIVENLSKVYTIQSSRGGELRGTLRDTLSRGAIKMLAPFSTGEGKPTTLQTEERWKSFHALRDVSFSLQPGEVVGVIGRNGAGKSTLLKILSRITEPTKGRVEIHGRVSSLLEVGTGFHPELTGRENIFLNGAILGMRRREIQAKFEEIVAFADVEEFLEVPVKRYSSGMFVRLAFSVAAHLEPEILIIDEVLAVGDLAFQRKCLGKMNEVATQSGRTILFVSHDMSAIQRLCHSSLVLEQGQVIYRGTVEGGITEYLSRSGQGLPNGLELDQRPRPPKQKKDPGFFITRCRVKSEVVQRGHPQIGFGDIVPLEISFQSEKAQEDFTVTLQLETQTHTKVALFRSDSQGVSYTHPGNGILTVDVTLPSMHLVPGVYLFSVEVRRLGSLLDTVESALAVEIMPISKSGDYVPGDQGILNPPIQWGQSRETTELKQA